MHHNYTLSTILPGKGIEFITGGSLADPHYNTTLGYSPGELVRNIFQHTGHLHDSLQTRHFFPPACVPPPLDHVCA